VWQTNAHLNSEKLSVKTLLRPEWLFCIKSLNCIRRP